MISSTKGNIHQSWELLTIMTAASIRTRITTLFGCKYPIVLPGMSWISDPTLVSAVSNAGECTIMMDSTFVHCISYSFVYAHKVELEFLPVGHWMPKKLEKPSIRFAIIRINHLELGKFNGFITSSSSRIISSITDELTSSLFVTQLIKDAHY